MIKIKMNQKQYKISQLMIALWIAILLLSFFEFTNWNWFFGYSLIGFITFCIFGQMQYKKGNFDEYKTVKK